MTISVIPDPPRAARILHLALTGGLVAISAVFLVLTYGIHVGPLIAAGEGVAMIGYVMAGCACVPLILAILVLKPRVPARTSGQSDAAFWQGALPAVIVVWSAVEGTGIIGAIAALLTGLWAAWVVVAIAIACLVVLRPSHFENG